MTQRGGRIDTMEALESVLRAIEQHQHFLVTAHARPDGDAVGSVLGCAMMLEQLGRTADIALSDLVPQIYRTLPGWDRIQHTAEITADYDAVILLECDSIERTRLRGLDGRFLINIDHHASGKPFGSVNWIEPRAIAVAEMVYVLARTAEVDVTPAMATCFYTALLTDTGSFAFEGTCASTFALAAALVEAGAQPATIAREVYFTNPAPKMLLLGAALSHLQLDGPIAWMWVTHEDMLRTGAAEEDCEGLANYAISIAGVEAAVFLRELPDRTWRLSLRSKGQSANVAQVAAQFGGGGHTNAGGCSLPGPLESATQRILPVLRDALQLPHSPQQRRSGSVTLANS